MLKRSRLWCKQRLLKQKHNGKENKGLTELKLQQLNHFDQMSLSDQAQSAWKKKWAFQKRDLVQVERAVIPRSCMKQEENKKRVRCFIDPLNQAQINVVSWNDASPKIEADF